MVSTTEIVIRTTIQLLAIRIYEDRIFCLQGAFISLTAKLTIIRFNFSNQRIDFPSLSLLQEL